MADDWALEQFYHTIINARDIDETVAFYQALFDGREVHQAVRHARRALHGDKHRRAYYNQRIELEDWLLPVLYQQDPITFRRRPFSAEEERAYLDSQASAWPAPRRASHAPRRATPASMAGEMALAIRTTAARPTGSSRALMRVTARLGGAAWTDSSWSALAGRK